jgi:hypothetical protein
MAIGVGYMPSLETNNSIIIKGKTGKVK